MATGILVGRMREAGAVGTVADWDDSLSRGFLPRSHYFPLRISTLAAENEVSTPHLSS